MVVEVDLQPMSPGFESRKLHDFFFFFWFFFMFFFCHYYYSANLQFQHYCLYSVSPTLWLLMMPRPPAPSALWFFCALVGIAKIWILKVKILKIGAPKVITINVLMVELFGFARQYNIQRMYSQTCIKGSPKGRTKIGCLRQMTP